MPVPRLFEASGDPREQWAHVLSTLLALAGPDTRSAPARRCPTPTRCSFASSGRSGTTPTG
jgi:hypothetical protein